MTSDGGARLLFGAETMPEEAVPACGEGPFDGESDNSCGVSTVGCSRAETATLRFVFDDDSEPVAASAPPGARPLVSNLFSGESGVAAVITVSGSGPNAGDTGVAIDGDGTSI